MSRAEGLYEAARVLREQGAFLASKGHPGEASTAQALSRQFESMAREAQDSEPTDRQIFIGCPHCHCADCTARRAGKM